MERYNEVLVGITDLNETIEEGINHIILEMREGRYEGTRNLLADIIDGIAMISDSIKPVLRVVKDSEPDAILEKLQDEFINLVECYNRNDMSNAQSILETNIIRDFGTFKQLVYELYKKYVIS